MMLTDLCFCFLASWRLTSICTDLRLLLPYVKCIYIRIYITHAFTRYDNITFKATNATVEIKANNVPRHFPPNKYSVECSCY